ncbi:hypothetical protein JVU11DRAFT_12089 [Chiua virens]|nr:hypothetical protein JVU11DRAFT_12089 [Chiua virens]
MPPRHLLGVPQRDVISGKISLIDLSGAPKNDLVAAFASPSFTSTYLVAPMSMYSFLPRGVSSCMSLEERIFPHLDLDHIPESMEVGGVEALSLGIYAVQRSCVLEELTTRTSTGCHLNPFTLPGFTAG